MGVSPHRSCCWRSLHRIARVTAVQRWKRTALLSAATVGIFCGWAPACSAQNGFEAQLQAGIAADRTGNLPVAVEHIRAAVDLAPKQPQGWYQLGLVYDQMAEYRSAEQFFRNAIQLDPNFAEAHFRLGQTSMADQQNKVDWNAAIGELREAVQHKPDYPEALNLLGVALTITSAPQQAIPVLRKAIQLDPSYAAAHFNLAVALENSGQLKEAVLEYQAAIHATPDYAKAYNALGKLLFRMGKAAQAKPELEAALRLDPDLADAHYNLARVLETLRQETEARIEFQQFQELLQRQPDATQSVQMSNQGLALASRGDQKGAIAAERKAVMLEPDYGVAHFNLGLILADAGDMQGASQELKIAISLMPGRAKPWFELGRVLERLGNKTDALAAIVWAAVLAPQDTAIRSKLAALAGSQSAGVQPRQVSEPALGPLADKVQDHVLFANELSSAGNYEGAIGELLRALMMEPADVEARRALAKVYASSGDTMRASLEAHKLLLLEAAPHTSQPLVVGAEKTGHP